MIMRLVPVLDCQTEGENPRNYVLGGVHPGKRGGEADTALSWEYPMDCPV